MNSLIFLLLPFAAASGWYAAHRNLNNRSNDTEGNKSSKVHKDYLVGLNFLLNEQPDKAVDIFIKMLEVDSDTVETHLALGSLFRRRGEVDRAIRIHQNLIARPHLDNEQRKLALLALGQDYMRAGVLDRAERIFLEMVEAGEETIASLHYLLDIYQQEKAWEQAITIARKLEAASGATMQTDIAHYYCELATIAKSNKQCDIARQYLKKALVIDRRCVRASLLQGELEAAEKRYKNAVRFYTEIKWQNPDFLSESIPPLVECFEAMDNEVELINYLTECLREYPRVTIVLILADKLLKVEGAAAAIELIADFLKQQPSIRGLQKLIELQVLTQQTQKEENLTILKDITTCMLENKPIYRCTQCGFNSKTLLWHCPSCKNWNTVKPIHGLEGD